MGKTKLEIFFRLDGTLSSAHSTSGSLDLQSGEKRSAVSPHQVLCRIVKLMHELAFPMNFTTREGCVVPVENYLRKAGRQDHWSGVIETDGLSFQFNHLPRLGLSFLILRELTAGAAQSWDKWIDAFLDEPTFLQAWLADIEYEFWQTAHDPLQYRAAGRRVDGLPMVSNGLPPPLEQLNIDTTANPARKTLRQGHVEAIGSTMWLAEPFWRAVGEYKRDLVLDSSCFHCDILKGNIVKVMALPDVFTDASTEAVQKQLRKVLFE